MTPTTPPSSHGTINAKRVRASSTGGVRFSTVAARVAAIGFCDLLLGFGGAALLWAGGNQTVADGPVTGYLVLVIGMTIVIFLRHLIAGRRSFASGTARDVRVDQIASIVDIVLILGIYVGWKLTDVYFLGWVATFSAITLILSTSLQLMVDITTGRNSNAQHSQHGRGRHLLSLEVTRIVLGVTALAVTALTADIHRWSTAILNLTVVLTAAALGVASLVTAIRVHLHTARHKLGQAQE